MTSSNAVFMPATMNSKLKHMPVRSIYVAALPPACVTSSPKCDRSRSYSNSSPSKKYSYISNDGDSIKRTNNWVLYLLTYPETSIRLEFGRLGKRPAVLILQSLRYVSSTHVAKMFSLAAKEGTTVQTIYDIVMRSRCDRYHFAPGGQGGSRAPVFSIIHNLLAILMVALHTGSRYWMYCLLHILRGLGVIESRIDNVITGLQSVWMDGEPVSASSQTSIVPGYFY